MVSQAQEPGRSSRYKREQADEVGGGSLYRKAVGEGVVKELTPDFTDCDSDFIAKTSAEMYHVLLNITTGEANAVVRRSLGSGWLAWKRLTSSLNPRTLASGIKTISAALHPQRITMASKADAVVDEWEDKLVKLQTEYGEVAVLYSMMPKDFQEKILDACAVAWDGRSRTWQRPAVRCKARSRWRWTGSQTRGRTGRKIGKEVGGRWKRNHEEANIQYIGKGGGKKGGKGFQGY